MSRYKAGYPPVEFAAADGTRVVVSRRRDGQWGWTKYAGNNRKIGTNGEGVQRCRAIAAAAREAGPRAKRRNLSPTG